jgi:hypothetical protein
LETVTLLSVAALGYGCATLKCEICLGGQL